MPKYVPEPTPVSGDIAELQRYLDVELRRISEAVNVKVDGAYGGIFQAPGVQIIGPLDANFVLFNPFDLVIPDKPDGVIGSPAQGSIAVLTPGSYLLQFTTTVVNIAPNEQWEFVVAVNGVATELGGVVSPSNQTEAQTVSFNIIYDAKKGDVFTILIASPTLSPADVVGSEFIANRVSEEF